MGIKELAAEAKKAKEAADKVEAKRIWAINAAEAETTVMNLLGLPGKTTRARNAEVKNYGEGSVVRLEEGVFVKVEVHRTYSQTTYWGPEQTVTREEGYLLLCDDTGATLTGALSHRITSLPTLSDAFAEVDKWAKAKAERAARAAAKV